jgi:hypothetical protein
MDELPREVWIQTPDIGAYKEKQQNLFHVIRQYPGKDRIVVYSRKEKAVKRLPEYQNITGNEETLKLLLEIFGEKNVIIRDAGQLRGEDSFGDFAGTRETPQDAAKRTGAKILINGSYFDYGTGFATGGELLIRDNKVLHGPYSDGYEICLRKDGTLFSPGYNTISSVLKQDVVFSWGTCEDLLIRNGKKMELTDYDWNGYSYPRTAIGMVRPLEYYIITAGKADYEQGITIYEEQEIFADLKCAYARGLDGGGSSALVIDGEYVNENGDRLEDGTLQRRAVADFLLFTE